jgi:hypothetical protein
MFDENTGVLPEESLTLYLTEEYILNNMRTKFLLQPYWMSLKNKPSRHTLSYALRKSIKQANNGFLCNL